ncbi:CHC2 zinc finger domain-containing protein [Sandarakinorhabdus sp.]|uniref:DUF7146 domain-containing protein n=1 Tax=Sandarakinorhabdus sp. TaxID=1916663 RepID=UPI00286D808A|nr:CHC2 zinc finger domain-containing protein [Sandarakinorhabdus sp.]
MDDDLFERARAMLIQDVVAQRGGRLIGGGDRRRSHCPLCGGGEASKSTPLSVDVRRGLFKCFSCGAGGDAVRFEQIAGAHATAADAARALTGDREGELSVVSRYMAKRHRASSASDALAIVDSAAVAKWMRSAAVAADDSSPVAMWLAARGLKPDGVPGALARLGWLRAAPVSAWRVRFPADAVRPPDSVGVCPAMVAGLVDATGAAVDAVHVTYLADGGRSKADLRRRDGSAMPSRKMYGSVHRACFALTDLHGAGPLIVGEGIETVWALAQELALAGPVRAVAVLSLDNLQGGILTDDARAFRLDAPLADPDRAPFVMAMPGAVIIAVDADMSPVKMTVRERRGGKPVQRLLTAMDRAQLCGTLAAQAWRRAGASDVRVMRPRLGMDFNDVVAQRRMGAPS